MRMQLQHTARAGEGVRAGPARVSGGDDAAAIGLQEAQEAEKDAHATTAYGGRAMGDRAGPGADMGDSPGRMWETRPRRWTRPRSSFATASRWPRARGTSTCGASRCR